jgi:hypothetical protein
MPLAAFRLAFERSAAARDLARRILDPLLGTVTELSAHPNAGAPPPRHLPLSLDGLRLLALRAA